MSEAPCTEEEIGGGFEIGTYNHLPQRRFFLRGREDEANGESRSLSSYIHVLTTASLQQGAGTSRVVEDT